MNLWDLVTGSRESRAKKRAAAPAQAPQSAPQQKKAAGPELPNMRTAVGAIQRRKKMLNNL